MVSMLCTCWTTIEIHTHSCSALKPGEKNNLSNVHFETELLHFAFNSYWINCMGREWKLPSHWEQESTLEPKTFCFPGDHPAIPPVASSLLGSTYLLLLAATFRRSKGEGPLYWLICGMMVSARKSEKCRLLPPLGKDGDIWSLGLLLPKQAP